jgi:Flp pilus assembly protein TadD
MNSIKESIAAEIHYKNAKVIAEKGEYIEAIKALTQVIQLNPKNAMAYGDRGLIRLNLGDKYGALADFQEAAQLFMSQGSKANYELVLSYIHKIERR